MNNIFSLINELVDLKAVEQNILTRLANAASTQESQSEEDSNLIDGAGDPYIQDESCPAGGGLDKRCSHNADALYSFYELSDRESIYHFLRATGWDEPIHSDDEEEIWERGDTKIYFECYDKGARQWGYCSTEFVG